MTKSCARGTVVTKASTWASSRIERGSRSKVPYQLYLTNKFGDVGGVASYSGVAKTLQKSGQRVLHTSRPQPYFPLVGKTR